MNNIDKEKINLGKRNNLSKLFDLAEIYYPQNSFRYKLIHSYLKVFMDTTNYLLVKDVCYNYYSNEQDIYLVAFIKKLSKLYSLIFYSTVSDDFVEEINDYVYIFGHNLESDAFVKEIYHSNDMYYLLSKLVCNMIDVNDEIKAFYYFLIIKKLKKDTGYYVVLPLNINQILKDEINQKELYIVKSYLEGQISRKILEERKYLLDIEILKNVYEKELIEYRDKIERISIFGSLIRGEYTKDSDIDLIVVVKELSFTETVSIKNKIKGINIVHFNRKSDIHMIEETDISKFIFEGNSIDVF